MVNPRGQLVQNATNAKAPSKASDANRSETDILRDKDTTHLRPLRRQNPNVQNSTPQGGECRIKPFGQQKPLVRFPTVWSGRFSRSLFGESHKASISENRLRTKILVSTYPRKKRQNPFRLNIAMRAPNGLPFTTKMLSFELRMHWNRVKA